ncbi:Sap-like sulfolipid-1-addressing protein [Glaciihabitans tibetensis]|uniref:Sap-like sulfolipid-1-addressing protein n=1 Tax=Glaciihabitans tibetensis TaxID=1266600 RepID=A0A2T0VIV9_9MICO|nr:GAP family protein [Glaciihabitans tibetensis]PRY70156.1 Sap-like sulfolipid-1-addressing protein [Glaciihabitans tibetensis]
MWESLGSILPIAVAVAFSSVPILATVLILLSPNRVRSGVAFLIGWVVGIAAVLTTFVLLAQALPVRRAVHPQVALAVALIVVGLGLIVLAVVSGRRGHGKGGMPRWLTAVGSIGPARAAGLALLLNIRPKAILLSAAAGLSLRGTGLNAADTALLVVIFTVIAASTVVGPIVFSLLSPDRAGVWLRATRSWIEKNNRTVTVLILFLIGVVVVGDGISRL